MKRFFSSLLLSLLAFHASAAGAFGVSQVSAAAPETFIDRCQLGVHCEKQPEGEMIVCSREPLSISASVTDAHGKTAGGYHSFGSTAIPIDIFVQVAPYREKTTRYRFEGESFGSDYVGIVKIQV